jgi:hypothetical protein
MAIVAVQIADLQITGIVLKNAGLQPQSRDFASSVGAGNVSQGYFCLASRRFLGCGELLPAQG